MLFKNRILEKCRKCNRKNANSSKNLKYYKLGYNSLTSDTCNVAKTPDRTQKQIHFMAQKACNSTVIKAIAKVAKFYGTWGS